jgi:hypothetical protein
VGLTNRRIAVRFAEERPPTEEELDVVRYAKTKVLAEFRHLFGPNFLAVTRPFGRARVSEPDTSRWAYMRRGVSAR